MRTTEEVKKQKYVFNSLSLPSGLDSKKSYSWTQAEKEILSKFYPNHSNKELSILLNKTKASIDKKAHLLGLRKSTSHRKKVSRLNNKRKRQAWTEREIDFIKSHYTNHSYTKIAEILNRTPNAVSQKARQLALRKYKGSTTANPKGQKDMR